MKLLAISALLSAATLAPAAYATDTGTLLLQGIVPLVNDIVVTPNGSNNLNLNITGGASGYLVASVAETSNNSTGYKINAKSANQGELRMTSDATKKTTYRLGYNGQTSVSLTQNYTQLKSVSTLNAQTTAVSNVTVDVVALPGAMAGTYQDTVTFQIVANN